MNECLICYESDLNASGMENMVFLDCFHSLCKLCLVNLQNKVCPFCRSAINSNIIDRYSDRHDLALVDERYVAFERPLRIQFRRRRRRVRMTSDVIMTENNTIIIEAPVRTKKRGKNNYRKGRWGSAKNHASIIAPNTFVGAVR